MVLHYLFLHLLGVFGNGWICAYPPAVNLVLPPRSLDLKVEDLIKVSCFCGGEMEAHGNLSVGWNDPTEESQPMK